MPSHTVTHSLAHNAIGAHSTRFAFARELTEDRKLTADYRTWRISVTNATQRSCPPTCPLYHSGCYAEAGHQAIHTNRLNRAADETLATPRQIAEAEAAAIRGLTGRNPLRLHVVGDCSTNEAADIVSSAAMDYHAIDGQPVWTYTHAWRSVDRANWRSVSVLASCETDADLTDATDRGYAAALVRKHEGLPAEINGLRTIPCPQQTGTKPDCARCMMCAKGSSLKGKAVIVFDPHGATRQVAAALAKRNAA